MGIPEGLKSITKCCFRERENRPWSIVDKKGINCFSIKPGVSSVKQQIGERFDN